MECEERRLGHFHIRFVKVELLSPNEREAAAVINVHKSSVISQSTKLLCADCAIISCRVGKETGASCPPVLLHDRRRLGFSVRFPS